MATFHSGDEVAQVIGGFLTEILVDPDLGPKFAAADAKVVMTSTDPEARFLLDCTANPPTVAIGPAYARYADDLKANGREDLIG